MNTGPFHVVQADIPGDFRTFKLNACACGCCLLLSFTESLIKTATFLALLGPYNIFNMVTSFESQ